MSSYSVGLELNSIIIYNNIKVRKVIPRSIATFVQQLMVIKYVKVIIF